MLPRSRTHYQLIREISATFFARHKRRTRIQNLYWRFSSAQQAFQVLQNRENQNLILKKVFANLARDEPAFGRIFFSCIFLQSAILNEPNHAYK